MTEVRNQTFPNLGDVKITFDDQSTETRSITSLGSTIFDSGDIRRPVKVEAMGQVWLNANMPLPVTYPNSSVGAISNPDPGPATSHWITWFNGQIKN